MYKHLTFLSAATFLITCPAFAEAPNFDAVADISRAHPVVAAAASMGRLEVDDGTSYDSADEVLVDLNSITKTVTAIAILHLVDAGRLSLSDTLEDVLTSVVNVPPDKSEITMHQLLTHSAGVAETTGSDEEILTSGEFLELVLAAPLEEGEGPDGYLYSNPGYGLLAAVIEVVSGKSYETFLLEDVLNPRGLPPIGYASIYEAERSLLSARVSASQFRRQPIHQASWGRDAPGWNLIGNGGLVTTAEGFLSVWQAFVAGDIVDPNLVEAALTPHVDEGEGDTFYGYGLVVEALEGGGIVYWHDGGNEAFSAEWRHFTPDARTIFIAGQGETTFDAIDALLDEFE